MTAPIDNPSDDTATAATEPAEQPTDESPESTEATELDELPEWARKKLTKANTEAASYRTRLREAEARLSEAKTPEELDAAVADIKAKNTELEHQLLVAQIAHRHELPDDLAARLKGATAEELEADAKSLAKYATGKPPASLAGGLDPTDDDVFDPVAEARKARAARR